MDPRRRVHWLFRRRILTGRYRARTSASPLRGRAESFGLTGACLGLSAVLDRLLFFLRVAAEEAGSRLAVARLDAVFLSARDIEGVRSLPFASATVGSVFAEGF